MVAWVFCSAAVVFITQLPVFFIQLFPFKPFSPCDLPLCLLFTQPAPLVAPLYVTFLFLFSIVGDFYLPLIQGS